MSQKILVLSGHANCGKTHTLNILKDLLSHKGSTPHHFDHDAAFTLNGLTICITPDGDHVNIINDNLRYFEEHHGNILITAARTRGNGVTRLDTYATSNGISIQWIRKSYDDDLTTEEQEAKNRATAELLLALCI